MKNLLILYLALIPLQFLGQGINLNQNSGILVQKSGETLLNAFAGGMNATQFESVDLNQDGLEDLVTFDRTIEKSVAFIKQGSNFIFDPVITSQLPNFNHWMRFVDYDGDGKKDLFCAAPAGIQVFRNTSKSSSVSFESIANPIYTEGFSGKINLYVSNVDIPAIADIDGDGDVDVLAFDPSGHYVEFHQNQSKQSGKPLDFKKLGDCWGDFVVRSCGDILLGTPCSAEIALESVAQPMRALHAGNSLNVFFHDGIPDLIYGHIGCPDLVYLLNQGTQRTPRFTEVKVGFPKPLSLGTFLNASLVDISGDSKPELLVSLSTADNNGYMQDFQQSNVVFKYVNGNWQQNEVAFLQNQMIDVGEKASTCFWDADRDGDLDLLIANAGIREGNDVKASIYYFENKSGVFHFSSSDFKKLKDQLAATNLMLQSADYDSDGIKDLIISGQTGQGPRIFLVFNAGLKSIDVPDLAFSEVPVFVDWNQDAQLDLMVIERTGKIRTHGNSDWGNLSSNLNWRLRSFSMADLDGDGSLEFVGLDQEGGLHIGNYNPSKNELVWKTSDFTRLTFGRNAQIICEDINADGKKDVIVGMGTGGISLSLNNGESPIWQKLKNDLFQIWPNPASDYMYVQTKVPGTVYVYDLMGRIIERRKTTMGEAIRFDTQGFSRGIYFLLFDSDDGKVQTLKFVLN
ncbi:MAG: hypothetical protein RL127_55 [Bacteroidota bacterium]